LLKVGGDPLDDVMDSARHGLYSWITVAEKPLKVRRAETFGPFAEHMRDQSLSEAERRAVATSVLIRDAQTKEGYERSGRPAVLGRFRRR
jgi:hypothetical protein